MFWKGFRSAIEFLGRHPFATGLLGILSLLGLGLALIDFRLAREESRSSDVQANRIESKIANTSTAEQVQRVESKVNNLSTSEQLKRVESMVGELKNRVGSRGSEGIFLFEEPIEQAGYFNEWWAHEVSSESEIEQLGQVEVSIRGDGKTVDFTGLLSMNCENGKNFWRGTQNFNTPLDEEEVNETVPKQVIRNVYKLFCRR